MRRGRLPGARMGGPFLEDMARALRRERRRLEGYGVLSGSVRRGDPTVLVIELVGADCITVICSGDRRGSVRVRSQRRRARHRPVLELEDVAFTCRGRDLVRAVAETARRLREDVRAPVGPTTTASIHRLWMSLTLRVHR